MVKGLDEGKVRGVIIRFSDAAGIISVESFYQNQFPATGRATGLETEKIHTRGQSLSLIILPGPGNFVTSGFME